MASDTKIDYKQLQGLVRPARGRITVLMDDKAEVTHTGIHLGDTTKIKVETARVIDVGPEPEDANIAVMGDFQPGQRIHCNKYAGQEIPLVVNGERVTIICLHRLDVQAFIKEGVDVEGAVS